MGTLIAATRRLLGYAKHPFVRHGSWALGGATVQAAAGIIANLILVRLLSAQDFGRFALVHSNIAIVASLCSLHLSSLLIRETDADLNAGHKDLYLSAFLYEILAIGAISFAILRFWRLWDLPSAALLIGTLLASWVRIQRILYERRFHYRALSTLEAGSYVASYLFTVTAVSLGMGAAALYVRCSAEAIVQLAWLHRIRGLQRFRVRWLGRNDWRLILRRVRGLWANGALYQSFDRVTILIVGALSTEQATGYFVQAHKIATTPHRLLLPLARRVLTNYLRHRVTPGRKLPFLKKVLASEAAILVPVGLLATVFADAAVLTALGRSWGPAVPLLQAFSLAIVCITLFTSLQAYCIAEERVGVFVVLGRVTQYVVLGLGVVASIALDLPASTALAIAVSAGYAIGTALVLCRLT